MTHPQTLEDIKKAFYARFKDKDSDTFQQQELEGFEIILPATPSMVIDFLLSHFTTLLESLEVEETNKENRAYYDEWLMYQDKGYNDCARQVNEGINKILNGTK